MDEEAINHYQLEVLRQLNDREFYKPLSAPIYLQTAALIKRTVNNMQHQGFINKHQQHFLSPPSNPRPRHFYTLPKNTLIDRQVDCTGCYTTWQTHCVRLQQRIRKRRTLHRLSSSTYSHFNSLFYSRLSTF